ncbi:MAG: selenocysteine-specific translation elongation factor [Fimbriimonadaceae bacterium]|nr:MAG: selenocysteine-specific translation elongation factor [Fimbriimonadaceae bacterium]
MAQLIGTAGHVDHGKTSLIRALTGTDTDRLPEEQVRGLTIDIGFASITLPEIGQVSIVDVPGHEKFVGNMLVGALGMDVVMLCVAADSGVMPQTIEHFQVVNLLPVQKLVVVITRADLADDDSIELVKFQVSDMLTGTRFEGSAVICVSSTKGTGLEELKSELVRLLKLESQAREGLWYLPVDRVFSLPGFGTVATGTMARGKLKVGEPLVLLPRIIKSRAKGIQTHGKSASEAEVGQRVAVNLAGIDLEEVQRGDVICHPGAAFVTEIFDTSLNWIQKPKHGSRVRVSVGSDEVIAKVFLNDNDEELVQFRCERSTVVAKDQPVIVRNFSPVYLLGGGKVTVPEARVRRKNSFAGERGSASGNDLVKVIHNAPVGIMASEVARLLGKTVQQIGDEIERSKTAGEILGFAGLWFTGENYRLATDRFLIALRAIHEDNPTKAMVPREMVAKAADLPWRGKSLDRLITFWTHERLIRSEGTNIADYGHRPVLNSRQRTLLDRTILHLNEGKMSSPSPFDLVKLLNVPTQAVDEILRIGVESGELLRLDENIYYSEILLSKIIEELKEKFSGKRFSAADVREAFSSSRKYVIPFLEYCDSIGVTMRQGDQRVIL